MGTAQLLQQKVVSGSYKNVSVKQVLEDLQSQSGLEFSYSPRKIPEDQLVSFSVNQVSLDEALQHLFRDLPVEFREIDGYIILKKSVQASKNKQEQQTRITSYNVCYTKLLRFFRIKSEVPVGFVRNKFVAFFTNVDG